jgi:hypothetical protein
VLRCDWALTEAVERWVTPHDPVGTAALLDLLLERALAE